jgi:hypothetical protein
MIKKLYIYTCLFTAISLAAFTDAATINLPVLRKQLLIAVEKSNVTDSLYKSLNAEKIKPPVIISYIGALEALKAKHTWNPYYKLKYLKSAEKTFAKAVTGEPHNIEIRFMRFSVEHNVPGFLGYTKNIVADRQEMIAQLGKKHYTTADKEMVVTIIKFLIDSKRCTAQETEELRKHLTALK